MGDPIQTNHMNGKSTHKGLGSQVLVPSRLLLAGAVAFGPLALPVLANGEASEAAAALNAARQEEAEAENVSEFRQAMIGGKWWLKLRYRFESVDQENVANKAYASTLRTVLGYETAEYKNFRALVEFEDVSVIGDENSYKSPINGVTDRPVVADPKGTEVNRVFLGYTGINNTDLILGRRQIKLDNDRFVGNVGWRQNEQTFDVVSGEWSGENAGFFYAFVENVNRIFGDQSAIGNARMASHLINGNYSWDNVGKLSVYGYLLDYTYDSKMSTSTFGARFAGKNKHDSWAVSYEAEYATQSDYADNAGDVDVDYMHGSLGYHNSGFTVQAGYESLGGTSDGANPFAAFQTPLATGHKFNGWADKFLTTPAGGLEDVYGKLAYSYGDGSVALVYHQFAQETGGGDYGNEIDAVWGHKVNADLSVGIKYADYSADDAATGGQAIDTSKGWLWAAYSF